MVIDKIKKIIELFKYLKLTSVNSPININLT